MHQVEHISNCPDCVNTYEETWLRLAFFGNKLARCYRDNVNYPAEAKQVETDHEDSDEAGSLSLFSIKKDVEARSQSYYHAQAKDDDDDDHANRCQSLERVLCFDRI